MHPFTILLVDDSRFVLRALVRTLRCDDYKIHCAESAAAALKILERGGIDLIISDENMPGTSGTDLLQTMRSLYPEVVRIMMTGLMDIEVVRGAINRGEIFRFFNKPWDDFELVATVRQVARMRGLERENVELQSRVNAQENELRELEAQHPGITNKNIADDGSLLIEE